MVRLLKTYQCLITSVILITLSSCAGPGAPPQDGPPEPPVDNGAAVSSPTVQSEAPGSNAPNSTPQTPTQADRSSGLSSTAQEPFIAPTSPTEAELSSALSSDLVTVTIYRVDSNCRDFLPEPFRVNPDEAIEQAIAKVLDVEDNSDFKLAGYRVRINTASSAATIDLRLSPNSPRQLVSLSSCEQMALFGSLRATLLGNPEWNIETVRFTERGQEIVL